jgi:hypothetical protein
VRWPYKEGSGSNVADTIGSNDGSVNGLNWGSGNYINANVLYGDGQDDYLNTTSLGNFGSGRYSSAVTVTYEHIDQTGAIFGIQDTTTNGNNNNEYSLYVDSAYGSTDGKPSLVIGDKNGNAIGWEIDKDITDGSKYRIGFNVVDAQNDDVKGYINGNSVSTTRHFDNSLNNDPPDFNSNIYHFAVNDTYKTRTRNYLGAKLDELIIYENSLKSQEFKEDYDRQPWS